MQQQASADTIAAIATPPGPGGISILRISGPKALEALQALFRPHSAKSAPQKKGAARASSAPFQFKPRYMHYGQALDISGELLDEALAVYMPGPHSFTGEDVAELHCHGGFGISAAVLEAAQAAGARMALPGEFSRRAFLNGRLDLAQAEAIAEIISAPGREGARLAAAKLEGAFSERIRELVSDLDHMRMQIILAVDFPDEEAELLSAKAFAATAESVLHRIDALLQAYERARLWREGALAVLAGRVNAGKSSLLNALVGRERAIVSPQPGTTRDYVEESVNVLGIALRICDTAGLRKGGGLIEEEGIRRSRNLAEEADLLLFVAEAGSPLTEEEKDFLISQERRALEGSLLILLNKADLLMPEDQIGEGGQWREPEQGAPLSQLLASEESRAGGNTGPLSGMAFPAGVGGCPCFALSAKKGLGLEALTKGMYACLSGRNAKDASADPPALELAPNLRQSQLLQQAKSELTSLRATLAAGFPPDVLGVHLDDAMRFLQEVTGCSDNAELINRIFADFCIGK